MQAALHIVVVTYLWSSELLAITAAEATPEPDAGILSVVKKSTTLYPNHYSSQLSSFNVNPTRNDRRNFNPFLRSYPFQTSFNIHPYQYSPTLYNNANNLLNYYGSIQPQDVRSILGNYGYPGYLMNYSLSPRGDAGWYFPDTTPLLNRAWLLGSTIPPGTLNPISLRLNNLYGWDKLGLLPLLSGLNYPLHYPSPLANYPLSLPNYPLPLANYLNVNSFGQATKPGIVDRLKYGSQYPANQDPLLQPGYRHAPSSVLPAAALHNAWALGRAKEASHYSQKLDYKNRD